jgi:hypothetical protein
MARDGAGVVDAAVDAETVGPGGGVRLELAGGVSSCDVSSTGGVVIALVPEQATKVSSQPSTTAGTRPLMMGA